VENGFTLLRCASGGMSGVATPRYSFLAQVRLRI
jgi:hypothetical protein